MKRSQNQKGQSLLELIIALFILVVAITATTVLIVTSIGAGRESRDKLIGSNLAREGIELVRNIRDSNWTDPNITDWNDGLIGDTTAVPVIDGSGSFILDFAVNTWTDTSWTQLREENGVYLQGGAGIVGNTTYYRMLTLMAICQDSAGAESFVPLNTAGNDCGADNEVGLRVISEVRYPNYNSSKNVTLEERFYNWQVL